MARKRGGSAIYLGNLAQSAAALQRTLSIRPIARPHALFHLKKCQ
jgi:hypothetical protein